MAGYCHTLQLFLEQVLQHKFGRGCGIDIFKDAPKKKENIFKKHIQSDNLNYDK